MAVTLGDLPELKGPGGLGEVSEGHRSRYGQRDGQPARVSALGKGDVFCIPGGP